MPNQQFKNIVLFGANGQVGAPILEALVRSRKQSFNVTAVVPPGTPSPPQADAPNVTVRIIDVFSKKDVANVLQGQDVVISALNGKGLDAQFTILDAAAEAGVRRFYPSEYGFHHVYRAPGDPSGYVHPAWDQKSRFNEHLLLHPAIDENRMSYTVIGCGDFYNQDREPVWCPWTQRDVSEYTFHVLGSADARADYTHLDDLANYVVATLCEPEKSHNAKLNFPSDTITQNQIAHLLEKYSLKPVKMEFISEEEMHKVIKDPSQANQELAKASPFSVDFWFIVKGVQGSGRFRRPAAENSNHLFPDVERTTFEKYFQDRFGFH